MAKIPSQEAYMTGREKDIKVSLDYENTQDVLAFLDKVEQNAELQKIDQFKGNCIIVRTQIEEHGLDYKSYGGPLKILVDIVENHGLPAPGHLEDHASRIVTVLEANKDNLKQILDEGEYSQFYNTLARVRNHRNGFSEDDEKYLHYLHDVRLRLEDYLDTKRTQKIEEKL